MLDPKVLGLIGLFGVVGFGVIAAALTIHQWSFLLDRGWHPIETTDVPYPSVLALSPVGYVQVANFAVLGIGLLAIAAGLWQALEPRPTIAVVLLGVACLAALAAMAPTDGSVSTVRTVPGAVHAAAFLALLVTSVLAALLLGLAFREQRGWQDLAGPSLAAAGLLIALTIGSFVPSPIGGLLSIVLELALLAWLALVALRLATAS